MKICTRNSAYATKNQHWFRRVPTQTANYQVNSLRSFIREFSRNKLIRLVVRKKIDAHVIFEVKSVLNHSIPPCLHVSPCLNHQLTIPGFTSSKRFCKVASSARSCVISEASFFLSREISVKRSNSFRICSFCSSKGARFDCFHSFKQAPNSTMRLISPGKRWKLLRIYSSHDDSCKTISCTAMITALTWYP